MITLNILKLLEDNDLGVIDLTGDTAEADLFFEKMPHGRTGVYIVARGAGLSRGKRTTQAFDLYCRGVNDVAGASRLEAILDFFESTFGSVCDLPAVPSISDTVYKKVMIQPTSSISNAGQGEDGRVVYSVSALVTYNK